MFPQKLVVLEECKEATLNMNLNLNKPKIYHQHWWYRLGVSIELLLRVYGKTFSFVCVNVIMDRY